MISLIVFGIIALIAVTLLLTFNIRSFNRTEIKNNHPETKVTVKETKDTIAEKPSDQVSYIPQDINLNSMSDQQYRNTLRQYHLRDKTNSSPKRHSDDEYRAALRSMKSSKK
jgi:cell division protein FtsN